jgi:glycerophosphoryl diester phosphodiesterase
VILNEKGAMRLNNLKLVLLALVLVLPAFPGHRSRVEAQISARSKPLIIAHRGGAKESTENTVEAFQRAARIGADGIETDLRLTRDGVVVIYHMTYAELRANPLTAVGDDSGRRYVPTLEEVLTKVNTGLLNIEIKRGARYDELVEKTIAVLKNQRHALDRVVLEPPDLKTAEKLRKEVGESLKLHLNPAYDSGVSFAESLEKVLKFKPHSISVNYKKVSMELIERAHRAGVEVWAWTLDSPEIAQALWTLRVDAIKTDTPTALLNAFKRQK